MEANLIIDAVIKYSGLNSAQFAVEIGVKTTQAIYDLLKGRTKTISPAIQDKILTRYPEINRTWLLTGDGEMLRSGVVSQSPTGDNSPNINGSGNANGGVRDMGGMIELQKGYQEMLRKSQSQIDRLLGIIERMQGGEGKE